VAILSSGSNSSPGMAPFDVVRRGYDRDQVDAHLRNLGEHLAGASQAHQVAEQRIRTLEEELRAARKRSESVEPSMSQESFGFRAEKILRLAEHEAADVRARAAKEATAVVEQARADAEKHRHDVEQALITRAAEQDREAAERNVAIQEREQQAQATLADAREESARITDEARRSAEKALAEAQSRAEQLRMRTDNECRRTREAAEQELRRLGDLRDNVRTEITRLHTLLGAEVPSAAKSQATSSAAATNSASSETATPSAEATDQKPAAGAKPATLPWAERPTVGTPVRTQARPEIAGTPTTHRFREQAPTTAS
jgi:chromosome segregation ATPase